ncbi:bifunctional EF-hand domain pair/P25-alpha [Babesia duncani]|uniref:Bifunctional EF-hand domain pair/P25-alpha n=1 Tax=Babesia duncani TaxID=323732 RepID=A0AAD9PLC5_9APIC|nr:bifunctional EF-hand domain pair/P25-alpha [Babesia duncani]
MELEETFNLYTNKRGRLESRMLNKMLKEAGVLKTSSMIASLDIVFVKHRSKVKMNLDYAEFSAAIDDLANVLKISKEELMTRLHELSGPKYTGTEAIPTRFHDDKASYTGVHIHGGPSIIDRPSIDHPPTPPPETDSK